MSRSGRVTVQRDAHRAPPRAASYSRIFAASSSAVAAFTIGYHIVNDYRRYHPGVSWETPTLTSATMILGGSHYQPCPQ